jgi:hypothetical protein
VASAVDPGTVEPYGATLSIQAWWSWEVEEARWCQAVWAQPADVGAGRWSRRWAGASAVREERARTEGRSAGDAMPRWWWVVTEG